MSDQDWSSSLDALESLLERQRSFIAGAGPLPDAPWDPPPGVLPDAMRVRALTLAAACEEIEAELRRILHARSDRVTSPYR